MADSPITDAMAQETAKILAAVFYRHDEDDGKTYAKTATVILESTAPEIRRAAMEEAAKALCERRDKVWDGCEMSHVDPGTGTHECSLLSRDKDCLCQCAYEALDGAVAAISNPV